MSMASEECHAHEAKIILPGSFVVLQGIAGDGLWNTIDSVPIVQEDDEEEFQHVDDYVETEQQQVQQRLSTLDPMLATTNMPSLSLNPLSTAAARIVPDNIPSSITDTPSSSHDDSFIVVSEETRGRAEERALEAWHVACRSREQRQRHDWLSTQQTTIPKDWWQAGGQLVILKELPKKQNDDTVLLDICGSLSPGSTVVGSEMRRLDGDTLKEIRFKRGERPSKGSPGQVLMLKLESPMEGYVTFSVDGYCFLGPGLPSLYTDPEVWTWRVTCAAGAFLREGLELNTRHLATLPYGSFLRVTHKIVNSMGLSRLRVIALDDDTPVEGWISEFLNPLSGQRGPIAQPLPFPVPALYRVTLPDGAVIRSDVELSSSQIGHAPMGAVLTIVGRAFSEHPMDQCIERLKLAGNGGWVSVRLNRPSPNDDLVFELMDIDGSFDPDDPGSFHLEAQLGVNQQVGHVAEDSRGEISSIDDEEGPDSSISSSPSTSRQRTVSRSGVAMTQGSNRRGFTGGQCLICLTEERTATIVHGETGHIACCLICARILKARGDRVSERECVMWSL